MIRQHGIHHKRRPAAVALLVSVVLLAIGAMLFFYGQALGALLVSACPDLMSPDLTPRCAQPRRYVIGGLVVALVGLTGSAASTCWLFLRRADKWSA